MTHNFVAVRYNQNVGGGAPWNIDFGPGDVDLMILSRFA